MRTPWLAYLSLALLVLVVAQQSTLDDDAGAASDTREDVAVEDRCAALVSARQVLVELEPLPNAHLESKIGPISSLGSRGWSDGLGWSNDGPLSTALRFLPRVISTIFSPLTFLSRLGDQSDYAAQHQQNKPQRRYKVSRARRTKIQTLFELIDEAEKAECEEVYALKAQIQMIPPRGIKQDLRGAFTSYQTSLKYFPDPEAQFMVGLFYATGLGGVSEDQGLSLLHYTFAALQGHRPAEMAMGYRHWAGISVKEDCMTALDYYEGAAEKAYAHFLSGPPGGRTLPLTNARLSDLAGGIYGPHASWASTGANALRPAVRAASASARGETEAEVLEYYQYHSDRDSHLFTVRLGRLFYLGSVYPILGGSPRGPGISAGAEGVGEIPQSYTKAREYFMRVARHMWPKDYDLNGKIMPRRKMSKEVEDSLRDPAMVAAAFLGRMALRGEGQKVDYQRARLWYERAMELGDREAFNGLGIIHRDGLGVPKDLKKAFHYFQAAAGQDLAEAQVNLGKLHMDRGELQQAFQYFEVAIRHGSPFEAFHLLSKIHATTARLPTHVGGQRGSCGVSVAYFKLVSERGSWADDYIVQGDRAWARGEEEVALVKWLVAAEMGSEIGQNNVAFLLDQKKGVELFDNEGRTTDQLAMRYWVRSAAQDNVDAMVKVGDLYYSGLVNGTEKTDGSSMELAATYYQTAADTQFSAMAYWNLGWMYEMGKGVPRDWHLAKRYYGMSGETALEAWPAVILSLTGLYLRSWWTEIRTQGEVPGLRLFEPPAEEIIVPSFWERIGGLFTLPPGEYDEADYDDLSGASWTGGNTPRQPGEGDVEWDEDIADSVMIMGIVFGIMGLVWLRQYWARREAERVRLMQLQAQMGLGQPIPVNLVEEEERRRREAMERVPIGPPII